jgi:endonuclease III
MRTVLGRLKKQYPDSRCSLDYEDPWQLLVSVILSAQCTDERVNMVTPGLFARWPGPHELAKAPLSQIENAIRSTGFYRAKARNLKATARLVVDEHDGEVPRSLEQLVRLPGVARKTANVVLHVAFDGGGKDSGAGIAVDTHVTRLANRLGFTSTRDARKIEKDLLEVVPRKDWGIFTHLFISHGRAVCTGRSVPKCGECVLAGLCPSATDPA